MDRGFLTSIVSIYARGPAHIVGLVPDKLVGIGHFHILQR